MGKNKVKGLLDTTTPIEWIRYRRSVKRRKRRKAYWYYMKVPISDESGFSNYKGKWVYYDKMEKI